MSNKASYARPNAPPPSLGTVLADVVLNTPSQGFATTDDIAARVGHHMRSIRAEINIAYNRTYLEVLHRPRKYPQAYRLTQFGRLVKQQLETQALAAGD